MRDYKALALAPGSRCPGGFGANHSGGDTGVPPGVPAPWVGHVDSTVERSCAQALARCMAGERQGTSMPDIETSCTMLSSGSAACHHQAVRKLSPSFAAHSSGGLCFARLVPFTDSGIHCNEFTTCLYFTTLSSLSMGSLSMSSLSMGGQKHSLDDLPPGHANMHDLLLRSLSLPYP